MDLFVKKKKWYSKFSDNNMKLGGSEIGFNSVFKISLYSPCHITFIFILSDAIRSMK